MNARYTPLAAVVGGRDGGTHARAQELDLGVDVGLRVELGPQAPLPRRDGREAVEIDVAAVARLARRAARPPADHRRGFAPWSARRRGAVESR